MSFRQYDESKGLFIKWTPSIGSSLVDWDLQDGIDTYGGLWFEASDNAAGAVATWFSHEGLHHGPSQATGAAKPTADATGVVFDGGDSLQRSANLANHVRSSKVPDASVGTTAGKGFTCVGITHVPANIQTSASNLLEFWIASYGKAQSGDATFNPALVKVSYNPDTGEMVKLAEILILPLVPTIGGIQGVTYDTSDNTLWFADTITGTGLIYHVTLAGALLLDTITPTWTPNGIAYNPTGDSLFISEEPGSGTHIEERSCVDGTTVTASADIGVAAQDQLCWDDTTKTLLLTYGFVAPSNIKVYTKPTGSTIREVGDIRLSSESDNVEGVAIVGNKLYVCNDSWFHGGTTLTNELIEYDCVVPTAPQIAVHLVASVSATTSVDAFWEFGAPLNGSGFGVYPSSTTTMNVICNTGASGTTEETVIPVTSPAMTSDRIIEVLFDMSVETAYVWIDGTQVTTHGIPVSVGPVLPTCGVMRISNAADSSRQITGTIKRLVMVPSALDRQKREGQAAWDFGLTANLPSDHPYKLRPPFTSDSSSSGAPSITYDAAATTLFAAMAVQPSATTKLLYNDLIADLKNDGIWVLLDALYIRAAGTAQQACLNLVSPSTFVTVEHGTPTFTANRGYSLDGVDDYLDTTFNPSSSGGVQTQNTACIFGWCLTAAQQTNRMMGQFDGTDGTMISTRGTLDSMTGRVNQSTGTFSNDSTVTNGSGLFLANRSTSGAVQLYLNGAALGIKSGGTQASATRNNLTLKEGTCDLSAFESYETAAFGFGGSLTATQATNLYKRIRDFLTGIGLL